ncbi:MULTISPECIES: hypothetical protein [Anaerostipes]|uniref:EAL domain-containing protein n=1 Tax=Anaerostipes hominis (ex Lee et al. 2021) TaxID=2025494 RepID=A0ABV4DIF2_9FIRM|nr:MULTISPECIES: hypothetical protein [Anaerostipes]WRY45886.1 hypothetical protein P8F77_09850 [Anaerostipes sp. PC18]
MSDAPELQVIAEGVETKEQAQMYKKMGAVMPRDICTDVRCRSRSL